MVNWDDRDDDSPKGHSQECTCEHCIQNYPERDPESWMDDDEHGQPVLPITVALLKTQMQPPTMCDACRRGEHWDCGMQTWCQCECDGSPGWGLNYDEP